jgi:hypothetical protein
MAAWCLIESFETEVKDSSLLFLFFFIVVLGGGYIVAFTNVLTIYQIHHT